MRKIRNHICSECKVVFQSRRKEHKTCSKECKVKFQSGVNNPAFGRKWTDQQRKILSDLRKKQFNDNPNYAFECGKSNRGVKFSTERIMAMHGHRSSNSYVHYPSIATKKRIGQKSKKKWTTEYKIAHRIKMESMGYWIPIDQIDPYKLYYKEANWIGSMIEYLSANEKRLLNENGIFGKTNPKGWVRDHIVPRKCGYELKIPAFILRHPANLQFISHAENVRKGFSDRKLTENAKRDIMLQLFLKIKEFTGTWKEQAKCLKYIEKNGQF